MIISKKHQLIIALIITGICLPLFAAESNEPNETATELKFENKIETMDWTIMVGKTEEDKPRYFKNPGTIKPTHVASVLLHKDYPRSTNESRVMGRILESTVAKKFSKEQREFFDTELAVRIDEPGRIPFYYSTWLYATSEEDAKLMVQAYIDGLNIETDRFLAEYKQRITESEQELDKAQKELPGQQKRLEAAEKEYKGMKNNTHAFSSDEEAVELAKKSIIEMDKKFNELDIELAGIRERAMTIEKYKQEKERSPSIYNKLDEMYIELMIELSGLEARRKATEQIYQREQLFLSAFDKLSTLRSDVRSLNRSIDRNKERIEDATIYLKNLPSQLQLPKVYRNTVSIHPVLTDH